MTRSKDSSSLEQIARSLTVKFSYLTGGEQAGTLLDTLHNLRVGHIGEGLDNVAAAIRELAQAVKDAHVKE